VKEAHKSSPKHKPGGYYFLYWFRCPKCKAFFMVESAKRYFDTDPFPNVEAPLFRALDTAAEVPALPNKAEESLLFPTSWSTPRLYRSIRTVPALAIRVLAAGRQC